MGTAWAGPTERDIINEGTGNSETDSDGEHECRKTRRRGRDGDVMYDLLPRSDTVESDQSVFRCVGRTGGWL